MGFLNLSEFQPRTVDKVERLLEVLEEMGRHPDLRGKLALYGGTAINLFMLDIPRLSVDIDIAYIGVIERDDMLAERPSIERGIEEVGRALGYDVSAVDGGHAGRTFVLRYRGDWGSDHIKVDCIFLNRSPLVAPVMRSCDIRPDAEVLVFDNFELAGGKIKAFFDRVKVRDLYDISNLGKLLSNLKGEDEARAHQVLLYYASLSARFPQPFEQRAERFADRQVEFENQLLPMLRKRDECLTLQRLMSDAEAFTDRFIVPRTEREREYVRLFASGEFHPELVLTDATMAQAASKSPQALWKLQNLRKMG